MALGSRLKDWTTNEVLTETELEAEFDNVYNSFVCSVIDDESSSVAAMQTTVDPGEVGTESQATSLQGELHRIRHVLAAIKGDSYWYGVDSMTLGGVPVGSIIPWYDFDATISKPSNYVYCDGSAISDADSALNGETTPDLSGRYLVGFGTPDGGGDLDSASWATAAVGNTSHLGDFDHEHTSSHTHSITHTHELSHTHEIPLHSHALDSGGWAEIGWPSSAFDDLYFRYTTSGSAFTSQKRQEGNAASSVSSSCDYKVPLDGDTATSVSERTTGNANDATTDSQSTSTSGPMSDSTTDSTNWNAGSDDRTIQPESIRVRYIMRIR
jgi:hypothetical protein